MAKVIDFPVNTEVKADAYLAVDLTRVSQKLETFALKAADLELIPWMNAKDVQAVYAPRLHAVGRLGRCELYFSSGAGKTQFVGRFISQ